MLGDKTLYRIVERFFPDAFSQFEDDYDTRLKVQKLMYLVSEFFGHDFYSHSWYVAGPYAPSLSKQVYQNILPDLELNAPIWADGNMTQDASEVLDQLEEFMDEVQNYVPEDWSTARSYEAIASIWYLANRNERKNQTKQELHNLVYENMEISKRKLMFEGMNELIDLVLEKRSEYQS